jgi:broad specificity phosphatase PhoE
MNVTAIYTSAYQRTGLTTAPIASEFGLTPVADARTNEWLFVLVAHRKQRAQSKLA